MTHRNPRLRLSLLATLAIALAAPPASARVVAIGDVHGSLDGLQSILGTAGLLDAEGHWAGGDATLVQTGDLLDRGVDVRGVMDLLMRLQPEAKAAGGEVVVLLGNHEIMNLMLEPRDVNPRAYASFAAEERPGQREEAWDAWVEQQKRLARWQSQRVPHSTAEERERWLKDHPPGYFAYLEALGPEGVYGKWLRGLDTAAVHADTLFLHGGVSEQLRPRKLAALNKAVREEIATFDRNREYLLQQQVILPFSTLGEMSQAVVHHQGWLGSRPAGTVPEATQMFMARTLRDFMSMRDWLSFSPQGPVWYRGHTEDGATAEAELDKALRDFGVGHMVVGHSSPRHRPEIDLRYGGKLFLIDTGMLVEFYRGRPSALEIAGGRFTAVYPNEQLVLLDTAPPSPTSERIGDAGPSPVVFAVDRGQLLRPRPASTPRAQAGGPPAAPTGAARYLGLDGQPLPFTSDDEVLEFLREADIVEVKRIPVGITEPRKVLLERNGVRAHAVFRDIDLVKQRHRMADGTFVLDFRDTYKNEVAAYELSRLLGLDLVPPTVIRKLQRFGTGSLQLWVEGAMTEVDRREKSLEAPDQSVYKRQLHTMNIWDNLINNIDRNLGNVLIGPGWTVWYIDHTRAFGREPELPNPERVRRLDQSLYQRLKALDEKEVKKAVTPHLGSFNLKGLMQRRDALVELLDQKVAEQGAAKVFFGAGPEEEEEAAQDVQEPMFPPSSVAPDLYRTVPEAEEQQEGEPDEPQREAA
ncbi:MAG TPA: metallophosphoesterase [Thermoanaerobaculia bacterium]|nr:metallophosphoesterase [Thermoanaerobaculia bacterium]